MGDRTPIEAIVYSCPPEDSDQVLYALEEFGLLERDDIDTDPYGCLELGRGYVRGEVLVGSSEDLAAALPASAAWKVWEDPAYEHLGAVHLNHPDLGRFRADCDALGRPMFASEEIAHMFAHAGGEHAVLDRMTGRTWEQALDQLDREHHGTVIAPSTAPLTPLQAAALKEPPPAPAHEPAAADATRPPGDGTTRPLIRPQTRRGPGPRSPRPEQPEQSEQSEVGAAMNVLKIKSPDELIATVPHILGFEPEDSVVCFAFGGGPTSRLDLPTSREEIGSWVRTLTEVYLRPNHPRQVALVAYGNDGPIGKEALTALSDALGDADVPGPDVGPVMWVNGDHWTDLGWGTHGTVDPSTRTRVDAEFALMGRAMPARGRESLATALQGDPTAVAEHLPAAQQRVRDMDEASRHSEAGWLGARLERFRRDRTRLSDGDAARVLAIADNHGARNTAVASMNLEDSPTVSAFWQDVVRRAPTDVRDTPATLLALSSFLEGRGAQAWVALDQVSTRDRLANLVADALQHGVDPREWERARTATTGPAMQRAALQPDHDHHPRRHAAPPTPEPPGIDGTRPDTAPDR